MRPISTERFFAWASKRGIALDERYPDARCLTYRPYRDFNRFWELPGDPATWPHFIATSLKAMDTWSAGYLWPRLGHWPVEGKAGDYNEGVRDVVLRGAAIPSGHAGAVHFRRKEEDALLSVIFIYLAFGWFMGDDLYFIPDHGRQFLLTSHHDVIHISCAEGKRVRVFVKYMAKAGYELPTAVPDDTFKGPSWMK